MIAKVNQDCTSKPICGPDHLRIWMKLSQLKQLHPTPTKSDARMLILLVW